MAIVGALNNSNTAIGARTPAAEACRGPNNSNMAVRTSNTSRLAMVWDPNHSNTVVGVLTPADMAMVGALNNSNTACRGL